MAQSQAQQAREAAALNARAMQLYSVGRYAEAVSAGQRLLAILAENIDDDYYPRNVHGKVLRFDALPWVSFDLYLDSAPLIEFDGVMFQYRILLRSNEIEEITGDADKILAKVFSGITLSLASNFESRNRIDGQDFRRVMFAKQIELLQLLNPAWASAEAEKHRIILLSHPFNDGR